MTKIFVGIISYRDPLLASTLSDLLLNESGEHDVVYGVFEQRSKSGSLERIRPDLVNHPRVRYKRTDPENSLGLGWARNNLIELIDEDADLYYQTDSHMLFDPNWDKILIADYEHAKQLHDTDKIIVTAPCKGMKYDRDGNLEKLDIAGKITGNSRYYGFTDVVIPVPSPHGEIYYIDDEVPMGKAIIIFGGNTLFPTKFIREVGMSPDASFDTEQIRFMLSAFFAGYTVLHPREIVAYHLVNTLNYHTKLDFNPVVPQPKRDEIISNDLRKYDEYLKSLGEEKLEQFRKYSGLDLINRKIEKRAYTNAMGENSKWLIDDIV